MGATTFHEVSRGKTPQEAFSVAVQEAQYMHGRSGYTGTIAEKSSFTMASSEPLAQEEAYILASSLTDTTYSNKWGPAGCIQILTNTIDETKKFLFFGWASE